MENVKVWYSTIFKPAWYETVKHFSVAFYVSNTWKNYEIKYTNLDIPRNIPRIDTFYQLIWYNEVNINMIIISIIKIR